MKQIIFILLLGAGFITCTAQIKEKKSKQKAKDPIQNTSVVKLQYDSTFIAGLSAVFEKPYKLSHHYILVEQDTVYPPEQLPINKEIIFQGNNSALILQGMADSHKEQFFLSIKRTNYTNFTYKLIQVNNDSIVVSLKEGTAVLKAGYVLSKENNNPNHLNFFPLYNDNADTCSFEFMFNDINENNSLSLDIRMSCKSKEREDIFLEKNISLSEVKFVLKEK
ncbi:MAG: hypothetical protein V4620_10850 [Bacteroidota bacterium]